MSLRLSSIVEESTCEPREYQTRIVTKSANMFRGRYRDRGGNLLDPMRGVLVESPTGSGKTVMALLASRLLQEELREEGEDLVVGWYAMRRNLLAQAERENVQRGINVKNIHFMSMFDKNPVELVKAHRAGKKILLVVDEAQHDAAASMAHQHNMVKSEYILGLTATPFRTDRMKLCFDMVIKDCGIHQLIQDGYLSKYDHFSIPNWQPSTVADFYCREQDRWGKSIFYFHVLEQCQELYESLRKQGVACDIVTGASSHSYREDQLAAFREGDVQALINCMVLTEGFDEPSIETAWVRDSQKGPTMQMAGRAFRIHPDLAKKNIVQSGNTKWPFMKTAMPSCQYIWQSGTWRSLTVNPHLSRMTQNTRLAIAHTEVKLPDFILKRRKKKRRRLL